MQEIHGARNYDFMPESLNLPKELELLKRQMDYDPA